MKCLGQGKVEKQRVIKLTYKNRFVLSMNSVPQRQYFFFEILGKLSLVQTMLLFVMAETQGSLSSRKSSLFEENDL